MSLPRENIIAIVQLENEHRGTMDCLDQAQDKLANLISTVHHFRNSAGDHAAFVASVNAAYIAVMRLRLLANTADLEADLQTQLRHMKDQVRVERARTGDKPPILGDRRIHGR